MSAPAPDTYVNDPGADFAMADLFACDDCHRPHLLFANFGGRLLCSGCWQAKGSPWPRRPATVEEIHTAELRTRERMQARGGADRHMVRSGKS